MADVIEEWRPITGFEGSYEVSNLGRVRSLDRWIACSLGYSRFYRGRVLRPLVDRDGYHMIVLGKRNQRKIHRLVLETFVGPCPDGMEARHLNGIPSDNRVANLAWGTRLENAADRSAMGTHRRGSRSPNSKVTEDQVREIRGLCAGGMSQRAVSELFGLKQGSVSEIVLRLTWRHVA